MAPIYMLLDVFDAMQHILQALVVLVRVSLLEGTSKLTAWFCTAVCICLRLLLGPHTIILDLFI